MLSTRTARKAALNVLCGVTAELGQVALLLNLGVGWISVLGGAVYGGLAYWAKAKQSRLTLILGTIVTR